MENLRSNQTTLERLNKKLNSLQSELEICLTNGDNLEEVVKQINTLEEEKRTLRKKERLNVVNRQNKKSREFFKELKSLNFPDENILTNDGYFHSTKVKKHKDICAFIEKYKYARFFYEAGKYISCSGGHFKDMRLYEAIYEYNKPTRYEDFESLEAGLTFNGIQVKEMTFKKFQSLEVKILKESERIHAEMEKSQEKIKSLNSYFLERENLINTQRPNYNRYFSI